MKGRIDRLGQRGMTLVEILIAMSILTIGVMAFINSFQYITKSIHVSRARTLAVNIAREKIENLRNIPYFKLMITTKTVVWSELEPDQAVDAVNYPPEEVSIGGIRFTRGVFVTIALMSGNEVVAAGSNYPDSGMKVVTVNVKWNEGGVWKHLEYDNLYENPYVNPLNSSVAGRVRDAAGNVIPSARVTIVENPDWEAFTGTDGSYLIQAQGGTYTFQASSAGYQDHRVVSISLSSTTQTKQHFELPVIGTGTVTGQLWMNTGLVISSLMASTRTYSLQNGVETPNVNVEYIELFNPTTYPIDIGSNSPSVKNVKLYYKNENGLGSDVNDPAFNLQYISTYVPAGKYYLIASTGTIMIDGVYINADAYYGTSNASHINHLNAGCVKILNASDDSDIDVVGWDDNSYDGSAPCFEGDAIPDRGTNAAYCPDGIGEGNQFVRVSTPPATTDPSFGGCYDSGDNRADFIHPELMCSAALSLAAGSGNYLFSRRPYTTADPAFTVLVGKPAFAANVTSSDSLGVSTQAVVGYYTNTEANGTVYRSSYTTFSLVGVATGTWTVIAASGAYCQEVSGVAVSQGATTRIPNAATTPAWPHADHSHLRLDSSTTNGYVAGLITDPAGRRLNVTVRVNGTDKAAANGFYFTATSSGFTTVVFNPGNANSAYVESTEHTTVEMGEVTLLDKTLTQGGVVYGFVTTDGVTALPNITVAASKGGLSYGVGVSDYSGYFYINNLTTGTYSVAPSLDPMMSATPASTTTSANVSDSVFAATFTIVGATGKLSGRVYNASGELVTTGALVLVSSAALTATPPTITAVNSAAQRTLYAGSSKADGTYEIEVRGSATPYYVAAYAPTVGADSVSVTTVMYSGVSVTASATTTKDIHFP